MDVPACLPLRASTELRRRIREVVRGVPAARPAGQLQRRRRAEEDLPASAQLSARDFVRGP